MENVRKRVDVKLLRTDEEQKILKLVAKPDLCPPRNIQSVSGGDPKP